MKAKVPEKIYLYPYSTDGIYEVETKPLEGTIEYVRKDAFVEKACEFISLNAADYIDVAHKGGIEHLALQERFIDAFKKYIEGE